ncbi:MAG: hypothetical protein IPH72_31620 [Sandaracinaceae bacterium]|nr:hypothetical protein [Sandaracinaceae bacterium]
MSSISDEAAGGAQTYTYDAAGNMITREGQLNTWDFMGRLSAVESQDGGQPVARFAYGATATAWSRKTTASARTTCDPTSRCATAL